MDTGKAVIAETSMSTHACIDPHKGLLSSGVRLGATVCDRLGKFSQLFGKGLQTRDNRRRGGGWMDR